MQGERQLRKVTLRTAHEKTPTRHRMPGNELDLNSKISQLFEGAGPTVLTA